MTFNQQEREIVNNISQIDQKINERLFDMKKIRILTYVFLIGGIILAPFTFCLSLIIPFSIIFFISRPLTQRAMNKLRKERYEKVELLSSLMNERQHNMKVEQN